ncbi:hypothetical protein GCM10010873_01430 [Cypionkella aquatica]|uniref:Transposase n=1 Tax=Cypionkella aquatica TaxID=1756042 RepID=A0AA37TTA1_9RHOB|nr:hypothetical protein GCM10010873_01430 [Cypionkella aquatica]
MLRAYPLQTQEMLFNAHVHGFRVFGGVPGRGIYDNMRTAVDRVGRGKERQVNARFPAMASHYVFEPEFCNPAAGWEKGQVEKNVQDSRYRLWQPMPEFPDLPALNAWLERRCMELWHEIPHGTLPGSVADVWAEERATLMQLPPAFDGFVERSKAVTDLIEQGAPALYASVPILSQLLKAELAERQVRLIAYHMKSARFPAYSCRFKASSAGAKTKRETSYVLTQA